MFQAYVRGEFDLCFIFDSAGVDSLDCVVVMENGSLKLGDLLDMATHVPGLRSCLTRRKQKWHVTQRVDVKEFLRQLASHEDVQWVIMDLISMLAVILEDKGPMTWETDPVRAGYYFPKRKRSDQELDDAVAFGRIGDEEFRPSTMIKFVKSATGSSVARDPENQILLRYFFGSRQFFNDAHSVSVAMDGVRVGKIDYLLSSVVARKNAEVKAALMPPQVCGLWVACPISRKGAG